MLFLRDLIQIELINKEWRYNVMNSRVDFIYLNEQEMIQAGVKDMGTCIDSIEDMFRLLHRGDYRMGGENANEHGIRVSFPKKSDIEGMPTHKPDFRFMAMPAYLGGRFKVFGIKSYGSNPDNIQKGLPRSILMMQLMDAKTGAPLAYMSANILSAMRTGATVGVGARRLSIKSPETVAIIGPGTLSRYTMDAFLSEYLTIETVKIKGRSQKGIDSFLKYCKENYPTIKKYVICDEIQDACKDADIIFFGTTNASKYEDNPIIRRNWIKKGALIIATSALLVDTKILSDKDVKLVADNYTMYEEWGKGEVLPTQKNVSTLLGMGFYDAVMGGKISRDSITDIGEILNDEKKGRDNENQIIFYAVGGMPIEDVAWGYDVYKNALDKGIGTKLNVWEIPAL